MKTLRDDASASLSEILTPDRAFVPTGSQTDKTQYLPVDGDAHVQLPAPVHWQLAMKRAIRSVSELRRQLGLPENDEARAAETFPTFVPLEYLSKIRPGDESDPLLVQVLASPRETVSADGFVADAVGDLPALAESGLLHKYPGRALIVTTGACGVHCRYCFRREFPYQQAGARPNDFSAAIAYIADHPEIDEVLLSGGDPLTIVDEILFELFTHLESIPHLRRLRIHTRMPIVIPQRITDTLIERMASSRFACWLVVHANHPRELCDEVLRRLGRAIDRGIPVLNQSVLLRGVNDSEETLADLSRVLVDHRIQPYYLHQLDRVQGAAHFEVPLAQGRRLVAALRRSLPGYAVPTYVAEHAGRESKTPLEND